MKTTDLEIAEQLLALPEQMICTYYEDKKVCRVCVDLDKDEHIAVIFEKGFVIVRTEYETKFVCKAKHFISLYK